MLEIVCRIVRGMGQGWIGCARTARKRQGFLRGTVEWCGVTGVLRYLEGDTLLIRY